MVWTSDIELAYTMKTKRYVKQKRMLEKKTSAVTKKCFLLII